MQNNQSLPKMHYQIKGIACSCIIGIHDYERQSPQPIIVDIEFDDNDACCGSKTDHISDVIDYATIANITQALVNTSTFNLIERLHNAIYTRLNNDFSIRHLKVTIHKPDALAFVTDICISND